MYLQAIHLGCEEDVTYILSKAKVANIINRKDENSMTPLHYAARYDFKNIVQILLVKGAGMSRGLLQAYNIETTLSHCCVFAGVLPQPFLSTVVFHNDCSITQQSI